MSRKTLLRICIPLLGRFPALSYPFGWFAGWMAWNLRPAMRRRLTRTMLPLCGGNRRLARHAGLAACRHVAWYWIDLCTLRYRDLSRVEPDHLRLVNPQRLAVLSEPGPVIVVSAHTGNAELAIQALTYRGRPFVALVEPLQPRDFALELLRLRSVAGGKFHEASFGGLRACIETLEEGGLVGVMGDRDIQGSGVCVEFCGRTVKLPRGPWDLARRTGSLVLPVLSSRIRRDDFAVWVEEPIRVAQSADPERDIREAIERWCLILEKHLRRDPAQWTVLEDFWEVHRCGEG